ncbi:hypothetical protein PENSTE_c004G07715 [Penicillium steckii]|uniref:Uncharacterized protein n=1 Tax=Penicillium steckii TaxID=303698 RepID=A0A1V6TLQ6_9EURO|nr:hypothetical protein PENSTE_c004G07715 [Penicillium steckii]
MSRPRLASPLTLETCEGSLSDLSEDDILGSDDDLEESARAAKRQRIEKIAESYQRGAPVFILSASLRGPFERGWKNPWKKIRRQAGQVEMKHAGKLQSNSANSDKAHESVIRETDPQHTKYRKNLPTASHRGTTDIPTSFGDLSKIEPNQDRNKLFSIHTKTNEKREASPKSKDRKRSIVSRDGSVAVEDQTFAAPKTVDWLKKDGKRLNYGRFDPPSSPTPKSNAGRAREMSRSGSRGIEKQDSRSVATAKDQTPKTPSTQKSSTEKSLEKVQPDRSVPVPEMSVRPRSHANSQGSINTKQDGPENLPTSSNHGALSFRVAASTSQLPRFQYQRFHPEDSSPGTISSPLIEVPVNEAPPVDAPEHEDEDIDNDGDEILPDVQLQEQDSPRAAASQTDKMIEPSKDIQLVDKPTTSANMGTFEQVPTEQNTYEHLPSAQHVSVAPGVSDRIISLHSTAAPADNKPASESNESQLSTQAALLHAQKSFQDDLESSEPDYDMPSEKEDGNGDESLLAQETPFLNPTTSGRAMSLNLHHWDKERIQAMSTQGMIDSATPFTFSTDGKPKPFRLLSPEAFGHSPVPNEMAGPFSPGGSPSSLINEHHTGSPSGNNGQYPAGEHPADPMPTHPSTTQTSALPVAISGSTPNTAQDGQGGLQREDSFNLSQAIADAGSWLRQSFDFMNEITHPSQSTKATSSAG